MEKPPLKTYDVTVKQVTDSTGSELSDTFYHNCLFCEKIVRVTPNTFQSCFNLGGGKFYCPSCLRNNFHHRSSRNVLIFSYRSIIGQYYYKHYLERGGHVHTKMWISEIKEMIKDHWHVGWTNPVLSYDPSTYLWFADFNKIGNGPRKAPFKEVMEMAEVILYAFKLSKVYGNYVHVDMSNKYKKAFELFYSKRQRPKDRRMLIPTLHGIVHGQKEGFFDKTREFIPAYLQTI